MFIAISKLMAIGAGKMKNDSSKFKITRNLPSKFLVSKLYIFYAIGYLFFVAWPAYAAGLVTCTRPGDCTPCLFLQMISNIIRFFVVDITAPLAGLLFLIGGIMMVSAGGNQSRYEKGKEIFKYAVLGVFIILASWAIVNTLITTFGVRIDGFVPSNWWKVKCL